MLIVYVDDILISVTRKDLIDCTVSLLSEMYTIRVLDHPSLFLGISLEWTGTDNGTQCANLSQRHAIRQFLEDSGVNFGKLVRSPMVVNVFSPYENGPDKYIVDQKRYQELIGSLLYFALKT